MMNLQPAQYASWLKKVHDPAWTTHRYRDAKDRTMMSAILDLEESLKETERLRKALIEAVNVLATIHDCSGLEVIDTGIQTLAGRGCDEARAALK